MLITAVERFREAVDGGLLKIMSKMGISVISSYRGGCNFRGGWPQPRDGGRLFPRHGQPDFRRRACGHSTRKRLLRHSARVSRVGDHRQPADRRFLQNARSAARPTLGAAKLMHMMQSACGNGSYKQFKAFSEGLRKLPPIHVRDLLDFKPVGEPAGD